MRYHCRVIGPIHARIGPFRASGAAVWTPTWTLIRPRRAGLQRVGVAHCAASRRAAQNVTRRRSTSVEFVPVVTRVGGAVRATSPIDRSG
jgi:hypothetical protein